MKKIVYIMGAGRSGTTLLDIILGNNPGFFSAGELMRYPEHAGAPVKVDKDSPTARYWKDFTSRMPAEWVNDRFKKVQQVCHGLEHHVVFYKLWLPFYRRQLAFYQDYLKKFFENFSGHDSSEVLIDSSKYALRGYYFSRYLPYEIVYIHIVRNPLDVLKSFTKKGIEQPAKGWLMTNLYLLGCNLLCRSLLKKLGRKHKTVSIRYNDLVNDLSGTLEFISRSLDLDLENAIHLSGNNLPFKPGLLFDGNRNRHLKEILVTPGKKETQPSGWVDKMVMMIHSCWYIKDESERKNDNNLNVLKTI